MMTSFGCKYQNTLYAVFFFCEESLVRDTKDLHNKDCSEMHSGNCSQMTSSCKCPIRTKIKLWFKIRSWGVNFDNQIRKRNWLFSFLKQFLDLCWGQFTRETSSRTLVFSSFFKSLQVAVKNLQLVLTMVFCWVHFFSSRTLHAHSTIAKKVHLFVFFLIDFPL